MNFEIDKIKEKVSSYVFESTFADRSKIMPETLIFRNGYLDSMGLVSLITFLEKEFGISVQDRDLIEENFESINAISSFTNKKINHNN